MIFKSSKALLDDKARALSQVRPTFKSSPTIQKVHNIVARGGTGYFICAVGVVVQNKSGSEDPASADRAASLL